MVRSFADQKVNMKKILIICAGLCLGGVERFAANISLFAPKGEFEFHYLVFEGSETDFEAECIENGAKILRVKSPSLNHTAYIKALKKILLLNHYDVVHSHTQFNSGINMWAAKRCGVPVRISHSHTIAHEQKIPLKKQLYEDFMRSLIKRYATVFLACGKEAGEWMYGTGSSKRRSPGFTVIHNGIDTERFLCDWSCGTVLFCKEPGVFDPSPAGDPKEKAKRKAHADRSRD